METTEEATTSEEVPKPLGSEDLTDTTSTPQAGDREKVSETSITESENNVSKEDTEHGADEVDGATSAISRSTPISERQPEEAEDAELSSTASMRADDNVGDNKVQPAANVVNDLETINKKRQEEKVVFQKLIDDVTGLESELSQKKTAYDELRMKLDVCVIDLDTEREKAEEAKEKVKDLEMQLSEAEAKLAIAKRAQESSADDHSSLAHHRNWEGVSSEEVQDLHMKVKRLTQDDEVKTQRVAHLEAELTQMNQLISKIEPEVGKERLDALRQHGSSNGISHNIADDRGRVRGNEVSADVQQSKVCAIL